MGELSLGSLVVRLQTIDGGRSAVPKKLKSKKIKNKEEKRKKKNMVEKNCFDKILIFSTISKTDLDWTFYYPY